jgi:hypothetical protein
MFNPGRRISARLRYYRHLIVNSMAVDFRSKMKELNLLPSPEQELLLKACLSDGEEAISAWKRWTACVDIDLIDRDSNRLLPLLYEKLHGLNVQDEVLARYKGVYRKNWYKNQLLMGDLRSIIGNFRDAGIETIVLKGAAMVLVYYRNSGLRPMADLDVLVPHECIPEALIILEKNGWRPIVQTAYEKNESPFFRRKALGKEYLNIRASCGFRNQSSREFDLHSHVIAEVMSNKLNASFWKNASSMEIEDGLNTKVLSPTDNLLHVVVHGVRPSRSVNLRWIADAKTIIERSSIDWDRFISVGTEHNLMPQLIMGMHYLNELVGIPIPTQMLEYNGKNGFLDLENNKSSQRRIGNLAFSWKRNSELNAGRSLLVRSLMFPQLIQNQYLLKQYWKVPLFLVYKAMRPKV